ncbi:MAG: hypothetical protein ACK40S_08930 [Burkholderiaceae bacterium]
MSRPDPASKRRSGWRGMRLPSTVSLADQLRQRHALRLHGLLIGAFVMAVMAASAALLRGVGVEALAWRYALTLALGYGAYLLVLRWWAAYLVRSDGDRRDSGWGGDLPDLSWSSGRDCEPGPAPVPGRSAVDLGDLGHDAAADVASEGGSLLADAARSTVSALGDCDEGAVVVVPVIAIFVIGTLLCMAAGSLAWLFFGTDALLAVAVELAFSFTAARAAMGVERAGWLQAAVRLTCKPMLGALLCAVALGAAIDHYLPGAGSLLGALRHLQGL